MSRLKQDPWLLSALTLLILALYGVLRSTISADWLLPVLMYAGAYAVRGPQMFPLRFDRRTGKILLIAFLFYIILLPLIALVWWFVRSHMYGVNGHWIAPGVLPELILWQIIGVALPEEVYFRGVIQHLFDGSAKEEKRFFGVSCGWGIITASLVFGLAHVLVSHSLWGVIRFFPGVVFGLFYRKERGLFSPTFLHLCFNLSVMVWR